MTKKKKKSKSLLRKLFFFLLIITIFYWKFPQAVNKTFAFLGNVYEKLHYKDKKIVWRSLAPGLEICQTKAKNEQNHLLISMFLIRLNPDLFALKVHRAPGLTTSEHVAEQTGAICVINGSFFDPAGRPLGLIVQDGKVLQKMPTTGMHASGIFFMRGNYPAILHRSAFKYSNVDQALQSMPRMIANYKQVKGISSDDAMKRRCGIAIDNQNNIILAITDTQLAGLSLRDFQKFFARPELKIRSALNLDGGRSSQLFFRYNGFEKIIRGMAAVPVFLTVFPK